MTVPGWGYRLNCETRLNGFKNTVYSANSGSVNSQAPITGTGQVFFAAGTNHLAFQNGSAEPVPIRVSVGFPGLAAHGTVAIDSTPEIDSGATVVLTADSQINDAATVAILGGAQLLLNGHTDAIGSLVLTNYSGETLPCTVDTTGAGLLGVAGGIKSWNDRLVTVALPPAIRAGELISEIQRDCKQSIPHGGGDISKRVTLLHSHAGCIVDCESQIISTARTRPG